MSTRAKRVITIIIAALGLFYEFWLWGALSMTPSEMVSKTSVWANNPSVRHWSIAGIVLVAFLCVVVWFGEPILKKFGRNKLASRAGLDSNHGVAQRNTGPLNVSSSPICDKFIVNASPDVLLNFFKDHLKIQAQSLLKPYIGQWMKISDVEVRNVSEPNPDKLCVLTDQVYLRFNADWKPRVSVLTRSSKITAIGQIKGVFLGVIELENCEILNS